MIKLRDILLIGALAFSAGCSTYQERKPQPVIDRTAVVYNYVQREGSHDLHEQGIEGKGIDLILSDTPVKLFLYRSEGRREAQLIIGETTLVDLGFDGTIDRLITSDPQKIASVLPEYINLYQKALEHLFRAALECY